MKITLEQVEKVMEEVGVSFKEAKEALKRAEGDVQAAIEELRDRGRSFGDEVFEEVEERRERRRSKAPKDSNGDIIKKLKKIVKEGNVDRIVLKRKGEKILSVPVNVGLVGGVLGVAAAPWAVIAGALAAYGTSCTIEVIKKDGTDEIL